MISLAAVPSSGERLSLAARARRTRLLITACDGVLTDGSVHYTDGGDVSKRFSVRDDVGVERLRACGIETAIVTRGVSPLVRRRAQELGLAHLYEGVPDKAAHLGVFEGESGLGRDALAYIGDDVNDLGIIEAIFPHGLTAAPADAMIEVRSAVHYRTWEPGGRGAFRDFAEWILRMRRRPGD